MRLVSVIVPVYNVSQYLCRCLKSITAQTYRDLEIILVDGGSTDDSDQQCLAWAQKDDRIVYVRKVKGGLGPDRNFGVQISSGAYLAFVDADDWVEPQFIEKMIGTLEQNNADLVFCDYVVERIGIEEKGSITARRFLNLPGVVSLPECPALLDRIAGAAWNKIYKRELYVEQPNHPHEDSSVMPALLRRANRICQVREPLYHYWVSRSESLSHLSSDLAQICVAAREMCNCLQNDIFYQDYQPHLERYVSRLIRLSMRNHKTKETHLLETVKQDYYKIFPEALRIDNARFLLYGGEALKRIFESFRLLDLTPAAVWNQHSPLSQTFPAFSQDDAVFMRGMDFVMVDFLAEPIELDRCADWHKNVRALADFLLHTISQERVFLLFTFLPEGEGLYGLETIYENADEILSFNLLLEDAYCEFAALLPHCRRITVEENPSLRFADAEDSRGKHRGLLNFYCYYDAADRMRSVFRNREPAQS